MFDLLPTVERPPEETTPMPAARLEAASAADAALTAYIGWLASLLVEIPVTVEIVEMLGCESAAGWRQGGFLLLSERHRAAWATSGVSSSGWPASWRRSP